MLRLGDGSRFARMVCAALGPSLLLGTASCALVPSELNLSPLYRHRLAEDGRVLELDVLWPIVHFEETPAGGSDFRLRPLYRRVSEGPLEEHQFLWPFGRVRTDGEENSSRLFPLWYYLRRKNQHEQFETDWYAFFPLVWGGSRADGQENYFSVLPFWVNQRDWLTYDRFQAVLFPLFVRTEKEGEVGYKVVWPLVGWGGGTTEGSPRWWHVLPFFGRHVHPGKFARFALFWPFLQWSVEQQDGADPLHTFLFWPFYGRQWSESGRVRSWTVLWPFFRGTSIEGRSESLDLFWPIYHHDYDRDARDPIQRWSLWPFVARTDTDDQHAWSFLWPLIWIRRYDDPEGTQTQEWVLPFWWHTHRDRREGGEDDFWKLWPFAHRGKRANGTRDLQLLSPWPYESGSALGVDEHFGWIWTLYREQTLAADDHSTRTALDLFTTRTRGDRTQTSVPFLFSYESNRDSSVLNLLQFIPIRFGASSTPSAAEAGR